MLPKDALTGSNGFNPTRRSRPKKVKSERWKVGRCFDARYFYLSAGGACALLESRIYQVLDRRLHKSGTA
jgi:hypothetical protein